MYSHCRWLFSLLQLQTLHLNTPRKNVVRLNCRMAYEFLQNVALRRALVGSELVFLVKLQIDQCNCCKPIIYEKNKQSFCWYCTICRVPVHLNNTSHSTNTVLVRCLEFRKGPWIHFSLLQRGREHFTEVGPRGQCKISPRSQKFLGHYMMDRSMQCRFK